MAELMTFTGQTKLDMDPARVLEAAIGETEGVVVCGADKDGKLYLATSFADTSKVLWWLRRAEHALMALAEEDEDAG